MHIGVYSIILGVSNLEAGFAAIDLVFVELQLSSSLVDPLPFHEAPSSKLLFLFEYISWYYILLCGLSF